MTKNPYKHMTLPAPDFTNFTETPTTGGERKLIAAMLHRVVRDFFGTCREDQRAAVLYLLSDDSEDVPFSYRWLCFCLDLNPENFIKALVDYRDNPQDSPLCEIVKKGI
jgi:hypothetical protein